MAQVTDQPRLDIGWNLASKGPIGLAKKIVKRKGKFWAKAPIFRDISPQTQEGHYKEVSFTLNVTRNWGVVVIAKQYAYYLILTSFRRPESMKEASNVATKIKEVNSINLALFKEDQGTRRMAILNPVQKAQVGS